MQGHDDRGAVDGNRTRTLSRTGRVLRRGPLPQAGQRAKRGSIDRDGAVETEGIEPSSPLCESGIFPLDDVPMTVIVRAAGIEPAVSGMSARRSRR